MKAEYFVIKREKCSECGGIGIVQEGLWQRFFEKFGDNWPEAEEEQAYWQQFGIYPGPFGKGLPPEEVPCIECEGAGAIESRVTLQEALAALEVPA